jgi:hypothetical protein
LLVSDPVIIESGKSISEINSGAVTYQSTVTVQSNASIVFSASQHLAKLTLGTGATATMAADGANVLEADVVSTIPSGAKIDLKNNAMIFRDQSAGNWSGSAYSGISGMIKSGKLTSSMTTAATLLTGLGVRTDGNGDTTVLYTYLGDADLDRAIDGDDYSAIDAGFSAQLSNPLGVLYANGDFNLSGKIDADDYWLIDRGYAKQASAPLGAIVELGAGSVPEPSGLALMAAGSAALFTRRRKSRDHPV